MTTDEIKYTIPGSTSVINYADASLCDRCAYSSLDGDRVPCSSCKVLVPCTEGRENFIHRKKNHE